MGRNDAEVEPRPYIEPRWGCVKRVSNIGGCSSSRIRSETLRAASTNWLGERHNQPPR